MNTPGNRFEIGVGLFLLLGLATLLVLAFASTNGKVGLGASTYEVVARFSNVGELRVRAPVKVGGVAIGEVARIELDPLDFEAKVTLRIDSRFDQIPDDSSAGVFTSGLLGERYVGIGIGGSPDVLGHGDELMLTQSAVILEQLIGKFIFGGDDAPSTD